MASAPKLTRSLLDVALAQKHENHCRLNRVREVLDSEGQEVLDDALAMHYKVLSATAVIDLLVKAGVPADLIPSSEQVQDHRNGQGACKCRI